MCICIYTDVLYIHIQSDLTYPHTSVLDVIVDEVRELDKRGSSSIVYSSIIADSFQLKLLRKVRVLDIRGSNKSEASLYSTRVIELQTYVRMYVYAHM